MIRNGGVGLGKFCSGLWSLSHSGYNSHTHFQSDSYYSKLPSFPTEWFIVKTFVDDEENTGIKYVSSKVKLCSCFSIYIYI